MTNLHDVLETHSGRGTEPVPGAVALVARGNHVEVEAAGSADTAGVSPMTRESIFRVASVTKPVTAAAAMMLVEDGRIALKDPVEQWLPELASPSVVRTPSSPVDDVVPASRPITLADLLTFRAGYGFPSEFSLPVVQLLAEELKQGPPQPQHVPAPEEWMTRLSRIPLLHQPGDGWLYNTCSDILGVLVARVSGRTFDEFLAERIFEPLGMADTGFEAPAAKRERLVSYYRRPGEGQDAGEDQDAGEGRDPVDGPAGLELLDAPDGQWSSLPAFPSGAGGLVSTVDDLHSFARMLLAQGRTDSRSLLTPESVGQMTTDQLTPSQREASQLFLEGQGWGFGGSVDVETVDPWNVPGRYGWIGGTGTGAHVIPSTGGVTILLSQVEMNSPSPPALMRDFWRYAASV